MASLEDEIRDLKVKNNELVQKVQHWKVLAGQRESENLNLMREINDLRLRLSRLRSNGNVQANNLDAALQSASEKALSYLVRASGEIARTRELTKAYMRDREELDTIAPRWNSIGGTPGSVKKEKVHRVPPLMMGGQSIQPVVALTMLNTSVPRPAARSPNPNRTGTERAVPMHMLQDVYIPLTRIDADQYTQNMETEDGNDADDSSERLQLPDGEGNDVVEEFQVISDDGEYNSSHILNVITEDSEQEDDEIPLSRNQTVDNPIEGPSWMLDVVAQNHAGGTKSGSNLEPDSTTEVEGFRNGPSAADNMRNKTEGTSQHLLVAELRKSREFSPTVRRRKRSRSPPAPSGGTPRRGSIYSPHPVSARRLSNSGRVLKVLVAKMRLDNDGVRSAAAAAAAGEDSPPKRLSTAAPAFDAPSPNGATVACVIVSETDQDEMESLGSGEPAPPRRKQRNLHRSNSVEHRTNTTDNINFHHSMDVDEQRPKSRNINRDQSGGRERSELSDRERNVSRRRCREFHINRQRTTSANSEDRSDRQWTDSEEHSDRQQTNSEIQSSERVEGHRQPSVRDTSVERHDDSDHGSLRFTGHQDSRALSGTSEYSVERARLGSCDSDSSGGERESRSRRTRKQVTYKEKPLNRKMRRC